jgi:hypothetical protein
MMLDVSAQLIISSTYRIGSMSAMVIVLLVRSLRELDHPRVHAGKQTRSVQGIVRPG